MPKSEVVRFSISMDRQLSKKIDQIVSMNPYEYPSRSRYFEKLVTDNIDSESKWKILWRKLDTLDRAVKTHTDEIKISQEALFLFVRSYFFSVEPDFLSISKEERKERNATKEVLWSDFKAHLEKFFLEGQGISPEIRSGIFEDDDEDF